MPSIVVLQENGTERAAISDASSAAQLHAVRPANTPRGNARMRIVDKILLAKDIIELQLRPESPAIFPRLAGQYMEVVLSAQERRAFSIANAPLESTDLELHIRHVAGGDFSTKVFRELRPGDLLDVHGPLGTLVPREDSQRPILFVAGGTGFAPIKALIEHFLHLGSRRPMTLYWGARVRAALYKDELAREWARRHKHVHYVPVVEEYDCAIARHGQVHAAVIADHRDLSAYDAYVSGPPGMVAACISAFGAARLPASRMFHDCTAASTPTAQP